jgi:hypothetical protein
VCVWDLVYVYCTDALFQSARTRARLSMTYFVDVGVYSTIQLAREESTPLNQRGRVPVSRCVRPFRS